MSWLKDKIKKSIDEKRAEYRERTGAQSIMERKAKTAYYQAKEKEVLKTAAYRAEQEGSRARERIKSRGSGGFLGQLLPTASAKSQKKSRVKYLPKKKSGKSKVRVIYRERVIERPNNGIPDFNLFGVPPQSNSKKAKNPLFRMKL